MLTGLSFETAGTEVQMSNSLRWVRVGRSGCSREPVRAPDGAAFSYIYIDRDLSALTKKYAALYAIPKGDRENGWIATAPHRDKERLEEVAHGKENFRNVIRLCKRVRDKYNFSASSFAIESAIVGYAERSCWYNDLYPDFRGALKCLIEVFRGGVLLDPFDNQSNLIAGVESSGWYAERLEKIVKGMDECTDWEKQDEVRERIYEILEKR